MLDWQRWLSSLLTVPLELNKEGLKHFILNFLLDVLTRTASDVDGEPNKPGMEDGGVIDLYSEDIGGLLGPRQLMPMQVQPRSQSTHDDAERNSGG